MREEIFLSIIFLPNSLLFVRPKSLGFPQMFRFSRAA